MQKGAPAWFCSRKPSNVILHTSYFHTDKTVMTLFQSYFHGLNLKSSSLVSWFGGPSLKDKHSLHQIVKCSSRRMGESQLSPESLNTTLDAQEETSSCRVRGDAKTPTRRERSTSPEEHQRIHPGSVRMPIVHGSFAAAGRRTALRGSPLRTTCFGPFGTRAIKTGTKCVKDTPPQD